MGTRWVRASALEGPSFDSTTKFRVIWASGTAAVASTTTVDEGSLKALAAFPTSGKSGIFVYTERFHLGRTSKMRYYI
ncbi:MAG: hypothetical protein WCT02_02535 [Candidatus Paceibacterota bacterium]